MTSSFLLAGSVAALPVAMILPVWSFTSAPDNFGITFSLNVIRICLGDAVVAAPGAGSAAWNCGWANAAPLNKLAVNMVIAARMVILGTYFSFGVTKLFGARVAEFVEVKHRAGRA